MTFNNGIPSSMVQPSKISYHQQYFSDSSNNINPFFVGGMTFLHLIGDVYCIDLSTVLPLTKEPTNMVQPPVGWIRDFGD